jgi:hypothetical protein
MMHGCNAPAKSSERLKGPFKQSMCSRALGVDHKIAIEAVRHENETHLWMACMQHTQCLDPRVAVCGTVAVELSRDAGADRLALRFRVELG